MPVGRRALDTGVLRVKGTRRFIADTIGQHRISAIIRTNDRWLAGEAMEAAISGGFRMVEFTLTTPGSLELISEFSKREHLLVGAGTVLSPVQAGEAVSAGARFLVSPITDREVIAAAAALEVPIIPGAYTPTEMETAHRLGADFVKVFPMPAGEVGFIEAVLAPLPHLRLFPTSGVTPENFIAFLEAGCAGVGFVRSLFVPKDLSERNFAAIRDRAAGVVRRFADWSSTPQAAH